MSNIFKTKKRASWLLALLGSAAVLAGAVGVAASKIKPATAEIAVEMTETLSAQYAFGDVFTVPECTFKKEGKAAQGIASLQFPDGSYTADAQATLNQSGNYVLRYIATIDGSVYTKEYPFTVHGRLASYESDKTSMEYGFCTHLGASSRGLTVRIANGDALAFDHVFDMTKVTTSTKLLEGFILPNVQGTADFTKMVFTFTDVEDPSVKLVYHGNFHNDSNAYGLTYFTAAGNGQIHCGLEYVGNLHVGGTLGCMVPHSFIAMDTGLYWGAQAPQPAAPDDKTFCISYDYKTNQAWAGGKIISDLDDSNYYDSLWFGFPSGKAKLTISALNYNDATANMCFTSILGVDLSAENYIDDEAPIITVDSDYETMPSAVVGKSYPIPTAKASDRVSGACSVNVSVWHGYGSEDAKMVDITDGKFRADEVGTYAIVYEASDYSGNVQKEVLWVRAYLSQYVEKLAVDLVQSTLQLEVGRLQSLPEVSISGGSGRVDVSYTLTKGKKECPIVGGQFRLEEAGEWVLTCTAIDYIGNVAVDVCVVNATVGDKPILNETPYLPAAYVSGGEYVLPALYANDYSSGAKVEKLCGVSVVCGGKTSTYQAGDVFTPTAKNDGETVKIAYTCDGETLFETEIPVLIVMGKENSRTVLKVEKYFYTAGDVSFENNYSLDGVNGLKMTAESASDSVKAVFAAPQLADEFSLAMYTMPQKSSFTQMNLTLTDSLDGSVFVTASLSKDDGQTKMRVGDTEISLAFDFDGSVAASYTLGFKNGEFLVNGTTSVAVSKTADGKPFDGFPSGKVYFSVELTEAQAGASIFMHKISGINANSTQDKMGPYLTTQQPVVTNAVKDSVYTVQKIIACDVFSPTVTALLTVISPSGEVVTSLDGVLLSGVDATKDYQISLTEYGEYLVTVVAKEGESWNYSNESYFDYSLSVIDGEKPTLQFKGDFAGSLKVGELLIVPDYEVSDNFTPRENIQVVKMIINPKGMPVYLHGNVNAIKCEYAGTYKIYFYVYDEMGNLTTFETSVAVG